MIRFALTTLALLAPLSALAADAAPPPSALADAAGLITAITGLVVGAGTALASYRTATQAKAAATAAQADAASAKADATRAQHEAEAMRDALAHHGAHRQAVGIVLNFPQQQDRGVFDYMTQHGWALAQHRAIGAQVPTSKEFSDDMRASDVLIIQGATKEEALAVAEQLSQMLSPGAGIILYNESGGVQHVFRPWGPSVQGATTIGTTDLWARGMYARRAYMAAYEGAARGSLADLKVSRQG